MKRLLLSTLIAGALCAQVKLPQYTRQTLPNGTVLNVMPRRDVPLVTIRVVVRGGTESDPAGVAGLSNIVAQSLRRGSAKRTADQFSEELDSLGASWQTGVDEQSTTVSAEFLAKDFDKGLDLLADALTAASFPEAEVKKLLAQSIDGAKAIKDNGGASANTLFRNFYYGDAHPYGAVADELALGKITRDAIVGQHKRMYVGKNMIVVVAGDIDPAKAAAGVSKALGSVAGGTAWQWKTAAAPKTAATRLAIIDKPDATQTEILVGLPGIERTHPDRVALGLVNTIFGGRFTSILNDELRVNSGLTYGARSAYDRARLPGRITISTFTASETTMKTVDMAVSLLKKLAETGITAEQLASSKAYVKGTYPSEQLETADQLADVIGDIELFGLNKGEVDDLFSRIDSVTLEKANEVARKWYGQAGLTMLLLGNASKWTDAAKKYDANAIVAPLNRPGLRVSR